VLGQVARRIEPDWQDIHQCVQELGPQAQKLVMPTPAPGPWEGPFDLVLMMDGWLTRERGPDWSAGPRKKNPERVEWKEIKSAVIYRLEQRAENASGRGMLLEKHVVATPPDTSPLDFGQAVREEAMRRGLARAKTVYLVMDGAVWLWDLAEDRFKTAVKTLDFHHAREHLNTIAEALYGIGTQRAKDCWTNRWNLCAMAMKRSWSTDSRTFSSPKPRPNVPRKTERRSPGK
jgi:hypothetical protein